MATRQSGRAKVIAPTLSPEKQLKSLPITSPRQLRKCVAKFKEEGATFDPQGNKCSIRSLHRLPMMLVKLLNAVGVTRWSSSKTGQGTWITQPSDGIGHAANEQQQDLMAIGGGN
jgi:hypothetical protein